ncbi:MAG: helix-turn-helix transcriptional regulator [Oscillospiraceae bacterium]|nr:helix-turn-helix transcriptional regulator [Oscillospiraceae bacterium]
MMYESIGKNLRKYRLEKKLRQEDLAERAGLSTNYIGMVERGEKIPSLETFITILNVLEVSADMVLSDVLVKGYQVKNSILAERIGTLSKDERERIYAVIDTLIQHK